MRCQGYFFKIALGTRLPPTSTNNTQQPTTSANTQHSTTKTQQPINTHNSKPSNNTQQQPEFSKKTKIPAQRRMRQMLSPHFQHNLNWWRGYIIYKGTKTRRYRLTPFQLFLYTTPEEREEYYDIDDEGQYTPGTLRYDWVGVRNHCRDMDAVTQNAVTSITPDKVSIPDVEKMNRNLKALQLGSDDNNSGKDGNDVGEDVSRS